ncbi:MAG: YeeE/YedE family protein [Acidiferrobacteraceae bacterium]
MLNYWPWWIGAPALGVIPLLFWRIFRRPLGISGSWGQIASWREAHKAYTSSVRFASGSPVMRDALMAATVAQFGKETALASLGSMTASPPARPVTRKRVVKVSRTPVTAHAVFLVSLALGGMLALLPNHAIRIHYTLSPVYSQIFGHGWQSWLVLLAGGTMVGFGTQMAGGCSSGHGLVGCATLRPASLIATATFFGTAVATSWLLEGLIR